MNEQVFDNLINYLTSEEKDRLYFLLEDFKKSTSSPNKLDALDEALKILE